MLKSASMAVALLFAGSAAFAQQAGSSAKVLTSVPSSAVTVTDFYKQNVYDPSDAKIGDIKDVLIDSEGRVAAFIVAVGGFLGEGEKDVATPFHAVKATQKNNKWYLVMHATKDELKSAPGFKYDSTTTKWVPEKK
jgi:sporulation protein YlmC with PRC-barrel domain